MELNNDLVDCLCGCGKNFTKYDRKNRIRKYVSGHNSRVFSPVKKEKIEQICKTCGIIYYRIPSLANRGKNTYCSNRCRQLDAYEWNGGNKNINWKGGFNGVQNIRWCPEYRIWRLKVFKRDKYICQNCKNKMTYKNPLHAHHIIKFSDSIELMFDIDNGITLCKRCHLNIHKKNSLHNSIHPKL